MTRTFSQRLAPLNMIVRELTGDMQLSKNELEETQVSYFQNCRVRFTLRMETKVFSPSFVSDDSDNT